MPLAGLSLKPETTERKYLSRGRSPYAHGVGIRDQQQQFQLELAYRQDVATALRRYLANKGYTQTAFGERFGVAIKTVSTWVNGICLPPNAVVDLLEDYAHNGPRRAHRRTPNRAKATDG